MSKFWVLIVGISMFSEILYGQSFIAIKGTVVNDENEPLLGASVFLFPEKKGTITDENGSFRIENLTKGQYEIQVSFLGYAPYRDSINIVNSTTYDVQLKVAPLNLQEVVVTDNLIENRKKELSLNVEIVNDDYLKQNLGGSLMNSLERLPGVTTIDIGAGQSKPVIRGLGFNRIVVVENSIKHEAQEWGADHGLEIDQYAVENIEVVKGPASLMYGSDAVGGVIDMNNRKLPVRNTWGGSVDMTGKTNNDFCGTSVSLNGRKKGFYAGVRATILDYADFKVPADSVDIYSYRAALDDRNMRNTAGREINLHGNFGFIDNQFQSRFYVSSVNSKTGFFANAHGLEPRNVDSGLHDKSNRDIQYPYQKVNHFKITNTSKYQWEKMSVVMDLGFQRNFRQEWSQYVSHGHMPAVPPDNLDFNPDLEREFEKYIGSGNLKFHYQPTDKADFSFGVNSQYQDNSIGGRGFIIPEFRQTNIGAFAVGRYSVSTKSHLRAGIRYDFGALNTKSYYDWFLSPVEEGDEEVLESLKRAGDIRRSFSNFTWSLGYNYNPEKWSFKANIGKSFRMPIAKELAANGVNYHYFRYEVGDETLSPEISWQIDAGAEYQAKQIAFGVTPFLNYFSNYIYLNPTSEHDRQYGNGNQIFYYTESRVFRYGGEIHAHYEPTRFLHLGIIGEYVCSEQLSGAKKGYTLPFSPPPSTIFNIRYRRNKIGFFENPYVTLDYRMTASQDNIVPPEVTTDGFQIVNMGMGSDFRFGHQNLSVSMQVQNLFNTKYFNHTSYYRLINVPEPGRNFIINISIPFTGNW